MVYSGSFILRKAGVSRAVGAINSTLIALRNKAAESVQCRSGTRDGHNPTNWEVSKWLLATDEVTHGCRAPRRWLRLSPLQQYPTSNGRSDIDRGQAEQFA